MKGASRRKVQERGDVADKGTRGTTNDWSDGPVSLRHVAPRGQPMASDGYSAASEGTAAASEGDSELRTGLQRLKIWKSRDSNWNLNLGKTYTKNLVSQPYIKHSLKVLKLD